MHKVTRYQIVNNQSLQQVIKCGTYAECLVYLMDTVNGRAPRYVTHDETYVVTHQGLRADLKDTLGQTDLSYLISRE